MNDLKAKYAKNILQNKLCSHCDYSLFCKKRNKKLYNTCLKWSRSSFEDIILKVVRLVYPNIIANKLVEIKYDKY
jgi:hypothetical protein